MTKVGCPNCIGTFNRRNALKIFCSNKCARAYKKKANPLQADAHRLVKSAVRSGKLLAPDRCERCDYPGRVNGHHSDYSKPLNVRWLCGRCHKIEHNTIDKPLPSMVKLYEGGFSA